MSSPIKNRSLVIASLAICMCLTSAVHFYYDTGLLLSIGDKITCAACVLFQPWLILLSLAGFPFWRFHIGTHLIIGALSGGMLALISCSVAYRWKKLFWPLFIAFSVLAAACSFYAYRDHQILSTQSQCDAP